MMTNLIKLKSFLEEQNKKQNFAKEIKGGSTVYFSDELAACYDLMIKGFEGKEQSIVIQMNTKDLNKDIIFDTWKQLNFEVWLIDPALNWIYISNRQREYKLEPNEIIVSNRLPNFKFTLNQLKEYPTDRNVLSDEIL